MSRFHTLPNKILDHSIPRPNEEVIKIVLGNEGYFCNGLCSMLCELLLDGKITSLEKSNVILLISKNAPPANYYGYHWDAGNWNVRKKWLLEMLNK